MSTLIKQSRLLFIICTILFGSFQFANAQIATGGEGGGKGGDGTKLPTKVDYHISIFKPCKTQIHSYVEFIINDEWDINRIKDIVVRDKYNKENVHVLKDTYEVDVFNVQQSEKEENPVLEVMVRGEKDVVLQQFEIPVRRADDGMMDVTGRMHDYLYDFTNNKKTLTNMWFYFCDKLLSRVELFAFFQEYMNLTEEQTCMMIERYAETFGVEFDEEIKESEYYKLLCQLFEEYYKEIHGDDEEEEEDCLCKLIRTKSTALNANKNNSSATDECTDYDAYIDAEQHDEKNNDNDLIFSQGRLGAAKAAQLYMHYDGVDSSPDSWTIATKLGRSSLRFSLVCVDPVTIEANFENCESCDKKVKINYGYFAEYQLFSATHSCFGCTQQAKGVIEDFALLAVDLNGETDFLMEDGRRFETSCDWDDNTDPTLQETISDIPAIVGQVTAAFTAPSVETITAAVGGLVDFWEDNLQEDGCDEQFFPAPIELRGNKDYILKPGMFLTASMVTGATFGGKVKNHGEILLRNNSDAFITGILTTIPNEEGEVPEYCDCEQIGSYVLASLDSFTPEVEEEDESSGIDAEWDELFSKSPWGNIALKNDVGEIIGGSEEWHGAFDMAGCCAVVIPCQSDCVYIRGCDEIEIGYSQSDDIFGSSQGLLSEGVDQDVNIYPNPLKRGESLDIAIADPSLVNTIQILNLQGAVVQQIDVADNANIYLNTNAFQSGLYIVAVNYVDGSRGLKKISIVE